MSLLDDALFCARADKTTISKVLAEHGFAGDKPLVVANYHYWGMSTELQEKSRKRFAEVCDYLVRQRDVDLLFIPMLPSDEEAERAVIEEMSEPATLLTYNYDYRIGGSTAGDASWGADLAAGVWQPHSPGQAYPGADWFFV